MKNINLLIDFDSTVVQGESLEHLADIALNGTINKQVILKKIEEITNLGMEGKIPFKKSLTQRLKFFAPQKKHVKELVEFLKKTITPSVLKNKEFFKLWADNIYIVSGGFTEYIWPVMEEFGVKSGHVLANSFAFGKREKIFIDKLTMVTPLKLDGKTVVLGDGYTDLEIKRAGLASHFFAFTENVKRERIVEHADYVVDDFGEFVKIVTTKL